MATLKEQSKQLEALINQQKESGSTDSLSGELETPELETVPSFDVDYEKLYKECRSRAKITVDTMAAHILGEAALQEAYVKDKKKQDIITLSDLYYQLELTILVLKSNIENVRMSGGSPRLYETFVQLSKNQTEINKQVIATESVIRQTYTALKHEIITKRNEEENEQIALQEGSSYLELSEPDNKDSEQEQVPVYRGTKQLILDKLKEKKEAILELKEQDLSEADFEEVEDR